MSGSNTTYYVQFGAISDTFSQSGSTYTSLKGDGATLAPTSKGFNYVASDGTKITFQSFDGSPVNLPIQSYACTSAAVGSCSIPLSITKPDGTKFTMQWGSTLKCTKYAAGDDYCTVGIYYYRWQGVTSSAGYSVAIAYQTNNPGTFSAPVPAWTTKSGATFGNSVVAASPAPQVTYAYPSSTVTEVTDPAGRLWHFETAAAGNLSAVRRPAATVNSTTIAYTSGYVSSVTRDGLSTSYARTISGNTATTTITDALSHQTTVTADLVLGQVTKVVDPLSHATQYGHDSLGRLTSITYPEGNQIVYVPDARGNIATTTVVSKTPGTPANAVTTAVYPSTCTNAVTCNKPTSITDPRLNESDYTYDPTHGGVLTVTSPAPTSGAVRPQIRYTYKQIDQTGAASSTGSYVVSAISACQTTGSCIGTADENKVIIGYGSNMLPTTTTRSAGDGSLSATSSAAWDPQGNLSTSTDPIGHVTTYYFDIVHQLYGSVGPDPDGSGPLNDRAVRYSYNADGQVTEVEQGSTPSPPTGTPWTNFTSLQQALTSYDSNGRQTQISLQSGGTTYALTQYSYDTVGRLDCAAQRMNPSAYGSLPAVCTLGTQGSFGPDRINRTSYDAASQITSVADGYGTPLQRNEVSYTHNANGTLATLADAQNNLTTYLYDGFDRLSQTMFPLPTTAGSSSTTDYELLGYDANSNVTSRRLRDGNSISYVYDTLNRQTTRYLPTSTANANPSFTYDLLGHLLSAINGNASFSSGAYFTYDALGHKITDQENVNGVAGGTKSFQYDAAGRRTRLTWPDTFFVTYGYDNANEMTSINENGGAALATFTYDDLGRRTARNVSNSTSMTYSYDVVSRLTALTLNGGTNGNAITLNNYSPAGEIGNRTNSNDAFAWTQGYNVNRAYAPNGINQYSTVAGAAVGYDARGNLTSSAGSSYAYSSENRLSTAGTSSLAYDALGRLALSSSASTRFDYDGSNLIGEYNTSGNLLRRYIFGPGTDEPIVWYEGSGTITKRYMDQDERGSITRITQQDGSTFAVNSYDEYGIPASTNQGRFQYTGQVWLPELGMYYYKARMYSTTLGRFMQTDPVGYGDGPNWYNYAHSNPINGTDPFGLGTTNSPPADTPPSEIVVTGGGHGTAGATGGIAASGALSVISGPGGGDIGEIVVTARRRAKSGSDILPQNGDGAFVLESRRGERGYAGSNKGTPNPNKHMKPVPGKPGFGQIKDPQTGKLSGPKPWPDDPRLGPQSSNYTSLILLGGGVVIVGGLIFAPEITIPGLILGGLVTQ